MNIDSQRNPYPPKVVIAMLAPVSMVRSRLINENPQKERRRRKNRPPREPQQDHEAKETRDDKHIDITA